MNAFTRSLGIIVVAIGAMLPTSACWASAAPAAAQFYPFLGTWHGHGQLAMPGQPTVKLSLTVSCHKAADGWAVRCDMHARNKQMVMGEADLMAVDTATGKAHWFGVTNQGEAYDFLVTWPNVHTMHGHYAWTQHGKPMQENVVFSFKNHHKLHWRTVDTNNKNYVIDTFTGTVIRK